MNNPKFVIKAVLSGQRLNVSVPLMASGTIAYIGIEASASAEWNDCAILCNIKKVGSDVAPSQFALTYDPITDKHYFFANTQVTINEGQWEIWFVGIQYEDYNVYYRITTESKVFSVLRSGSYESTVPIERPELYEQAIAIAEDARRTADEIMALYHAGELTGPTGPEGEQGPAGQIIGVSAQYFTDETGQPRVFVSNNGTSEQANLIFSFYNLKGDKGDKGDKGNTGSRGPRGLPGTDAPTDYVLVQDTMPTSPTNVLWIKSNNTQGIRLYTADEIDQLLSGESNIFIAEHGTTTFDEIKNAYDSGQYVIAHYTTDDDEEIYAPLTEYSEGTTTDTFRFSTISDTSIFGEILLRSIVCSIYKLTLPPLESWGYGTYDMASKSYADNSSNYVRSSIAPIENGSTSDHAYAQGDFFYHNGNFCKAKTAIEIDDTFVLNANYDVTTVSAEFGSGGAYPSGDGVSY